MIRDNNECVNYFRVDIINLLPEEFWMLCNRRKKAIYFIHGTILEQKAINNIKHDMI